VATTSPDTRERLLLAAAELFAAHGCHGTTVREIARRAGANVAAANYHFGSKNELYLGVLRRHFGEIRSRLEEQTPLPEGPALRRLPRNDVVDLLRRRIATMLELLIGPPPGLHGSLMIREMIDPSEALPVIVAEFIRPQMSDLGAILRRLAPGLGETEIERSIFSIIGQILFYRLTRPVQLLLARRRELPAGLAREVAHHIAELSVGGMDRLASAHGAAAHGRRRHAS